MEMPKCMNAWSVCGGADPMVRGWPPGQPAITPINSCATWEASSMEIPSSLTSRAPCMKGKDGISRTIYVTASGLRVVVIRVFVKKTRKTPRQEIALALERAKEVRNQ